MGPLRTPPNPGPAHGLPGNTHVRPDRRDDHPLPTHDTCAAAVPHTGTGSARARHRGHLRLGGRNLFRTSRVIPVKHSRPGPSRCTGKVPVGWHDDHAYARPRRRRARWRW